VTNKKKSKVLSNFITEVDEKIQLTCMHTEFELKRQKQMNHRAILLKVGAQDERSISAEGRKRHQRIREPPHNLHGPEIKPEEIIVGSLDECNPAPLSEPV
jgi:hypothetical protein